MEAGQGTYIDPLEDGQVCSYDSARRNLNLVVGQRIHSIEVTIEAAVQDKQFAGGSQSYLIPMMS